MLPFLLTSIIATNPLALVDLRDNSTALDSIAAADPDEVFHVDISISDDDWDDDDHWDEDDTPRLYVSESDRAKLSELCEDAPSYRAPTVCASVSETERPDEFIWDDAYFMMGMAPATTFVPGTFHPSLRCDAEIGMTWYHPHKPRVLTVGVDGHLFNLFDRSTPGGGADVVGSASFGPMYMRAGLGVLGGLPSGLDSRVTRPAVGGLVGVGVQVGDGDWGGRVGVDYDLRVDRGLAVMHTALLSARFFWGF